MTSLENVSDVDAQINCLQEAITLSQRLKEQLVRLQNEKEEALKKCSKLQAELDSLMKKDCPNCNVLLNKLNKHRKEREALKKEERAKLLVTIAKSLENLDDGNTNQVSNAHQLFTQIFCGNLEDSPRNKPSVKKNPTLITDSDFSDEESNSRILVNETLVETDNEESFNNCNSKPVNRVIVPETEVAQSDFPQPTKHVLHKKMFKSCTSSKDEKNNQVKEGNSLYKERDEVEPQVKKLKSSPDLSSALETGSHKIKPSNSSYCQYLQEVKSTRAMKNCTAKSPSVLSEIIEPIETPDNIRLNDSTIVQEGNETSWKMKPSILPESSTVPGKKLKQMTLSLSRMEKKQDISLSQSFKGGIGDSGVVKKEETDVVFCSPEQPSKNFTKKLEWTQGSVDDADMTLFQPKITSTCLPTMNTSFDRFPEPDKSPPYKYRRDAVRKRDDRQKLPGQDCDQCAKYYEAAELDKTQDIRARMDRCSRHRDKYQLRANTPPGFWDPVFPATPEECSHGANSG